MRPSAPYPEGPSAALCVSLHDVSPSTWPECGRLLAMIDALGPVPVTLLVVPDYHHRGRIDGQREFLRAIDGRLARGDEVVLHGCYHVDEQPMPRTPLAWLKRRVYTAGEGEFSALDEGEAMSRLERGLELFHDIGWPVHGFVAPAWLMSVGTRAALVRLPFSYATTLGAILRLPDLLAWRSPAMVYSVRGPVRRLLSRMWNVRLCRYLERGAAPLRMGLHPADAHYPAVVRHWQSLIGRALTGRRAMTKHAWIEAAACAAPVSG